MLDDLHECYRMLEVEPGASLDEVKRSYRELVKVWHPDRFSHDPKLRDKAVDKLKKINRAYERLCEASETFRFTAPPGKEPGSTSQKRRAAYEERAYERARQREEREPPPPPPPPPPPRPSQREVWLQRLRYGGPIAGVLVSLFLIVALYPEPEPRFLIEVPPDEPLAKPAPPQGGAVPRARPKPPPTFELPPQKFFGVGSTKEEVIDAQGHPDRATDDLFVYGTSDVYFEAGRVKSWRNGFPRLKIKMVATANLGGREYFSVGSTKDQVIHAQGTPDAFTESTFTYGASKVYFTNGKVTSWRVRYPGLNVRLLPSGDIGSPTHFTVGSTKDEVLAVQGTPDELTESEFGYGTSRVYFEQGRVRSWHSRSPKLNVEPAT